MEDLAAIEARIWSMLEPCRAELEEATMYGMPSLRWPGAKAHDYFASVNTGESLTEATHRLGARAIPREGDGRGERSRAATSYVQVVRFVEPPNRQLSVGASA